MTARDFRFPSTEVENPRWLPSFFVIGPPRTGTTWLHRVLGDCSILPARTKETRFFDKYFHKGLGWYRARLPKAINGRPVGEVAPTYFASGEARERIARLVPDARVVCTFRDPVQRILSLYRLKRFYGMIPWGLEEALHRDPEMIESGKYAMHLKAWQQALGKNQILVTFYQDMQSKPQVYLDAMSDFAGLPRVSIGAHAHKVHASENMTHPRWYQWTRGATGLADWLKAHQMDELVTRVKRTRLTRIFLGGGRAFEVPSSECLERIRNIFRAEVEELEAMLNRDLSEWKEGEPTSPDANMPRCVQSA